MDTQTHSTASWPSNPGQGNGETCVTATIEDHAMSSAVLAFAIGVGAGIAAVSLLSEVAFAPRRLSLPERLGQQVWDAAGKVMPDSLSR